MTNSVRKYLWRLVTLGSLAAVLALGFGGPPPRVSAATDGVLEGDVVNKTTGGTIPANTPVELQAYKAMTAFENRAATADAAGHFRFDKLDTGQEFSYQIIVHYKNTSYFSDITSLTATPQPAADQDRRLRADYRFRGDSRRAGPRHRGGVAAQPAVCPTLRADQPRRSCLRRSR